LIRSSSINWKIYAAGSGEDMFSQEETAREVIDLGGKENPNVLYIGTATYDDEKSQHNQTKQFVKLGANVTPLKLVKNEYNKNQLDQMFQNADIIIVSGGNTLFAIDKWKKYNVDKRIINAGKKGKVLAGGSAGGIVWFDGGHSDSMDPSTYLNPPGPIINPSLSKSELDESWAYLRVPGLSILPGLFCPHYDKIEGNGVLRATNFTKILQLHSGERGIGIDNWAAFVVDGNQYKIISRKGKNGSVSSDGQYTSHTSNGKPGGFTLEIDSEGNLNRNLIPSEGYVSNVLRKAKYITQSNFLKVARIQNPLN